MRSTAAVNWSRRASPRSRAVRSTCARPGGRTSTPHPSDVRSPARCSCGPCSPTTSTSGATVRRSRATTSSGSTGTACWPTRGCASTSRGSTPTSSSELGGRSEMSQWLVEHDLPYRDSSEKAYSTDANIWGATHEAKTLEHLDVSLETVEPIMGVRFWDPSVPIETEDVTVRFVAGRPVAINGVAFDDPVALVDRGERRGGPARARHVRPDREPDHRGEVPGDLRGAGNGAALDHLRAAAQRDPQRGHHRHVPRRGPPAGAVALRRALARPAVAHAAGVHPAMGGVAGHRRGDRAAAPRGRLHGHSTPRSRAVVPPGQAVDGAYGERGVRTGRPHRSVDHAQPGHRRLPRTNSSSTPGERAASSTAATCSASSSRGSRRAVRSGSPPTRGLPDGRTPTTPPWTTRRWSSALTDASGTAAGRLWGGRFAGGPSPELVALSVSTHFDWRLAAVDLRSSKAHARVLGRAGLLSADELASMLQGLDELLAEVEAGTLHPDPDDEDVHGALERELVQRLGPLGGKLRAGRSRNDQIATDLRLYLRGHVRFLAGLVLDLVVALADQADAHVGVAMPGMTHLQHAQPVLLGHHLLAHAQALLRDVDRLRDWDARAAVSPSGPARSPGRRCRSTRRRWRPNSDSTRPPRTRSTPSATATSPPSTCSPPSMVGIHLSRLAEEVIVWATPAFRWVRLPDAWSTGSSIMPQKKNPDIAELARGKSGRLIGDLTGLLATLKALPLSYDRDLQEDKEPVFDTADQLVMLLPAVTGLVTHLWFDVDRLRAAAPSGSPWRPTSRSGWCAGASRSVTRTRSAGRSCPGASRRPGTARPHRRRTAGRSTPGWSGRGRCSRSRGRSPPARPSVAPPRYASPSRPTRLRGGVAGRPWVGRAEARRPLTPLSPAAQVLERVRSRGARVAGRDAGLRRRGPGRRAHHRGRGLPRGRRRVAHLPRPTARTEVMFGPRGSPVRVLRLRHALGGQRQLRPGRVGAGGPDPGGRDRRGPRARAVPPPDRSPRGRPGPGAGPVGVGTGLDRRGARGRPAGPDVAGRGCSPASRPGARERRRRAAGSGCGGAARCRGAGGSGAIRRCRPTARAPETAGTGDRHPPEPS